MICRITLERILRDDDDASGQTVREWRMEREGDHITIRSPHSSGFILIRATDVDQFHKDLDAMKRIGL